MSRVPSDVPERLLGGDATDFERRVIDSARGKKPSAAASARMAKALGVSMTGVGSAAAASAVAAKATSSGAAAAAGSSSIWTWVSVGIVGLAVAGGVGGTRAWHRAQERAPVVAPRPAPTATAPAPAAPAEMGPVAPAAVREPTRDLGPPPRHARIATAGGDLHDEIELIDAARRAVSAHAGTQALEILRRYQAKCPSGSFRPEAAAIKIEALMALGRDVEARSLAKQFIADHRGSLLASRVAALVGSSEPPATP
jgi:hypothetical protein